MRESQVTGAVLGAAIGDALGHPTEFLDRAEIRARYGPAGIQGFDFSLRGNRPGLARYTDDTQMAEIVLRALVDEGIGEARREPAMRAMGRGFAGWLENPQGGHRAPGNSCMAGARRLRAGVPWREAGATDAGGCGSVMRAYPFGLLPHPESAERWAVDHSFMTHGHPWALAACAAMAVGMAAELRGQAPDVVLSSMVDAASRHDQHTARLVQEAVDAGLRGDDPEPVLDALPSWKADEAIAAGAFLLARYPDDFRAAVLQGANAPGDSDSIATLAGALLGARLGLEAIPRDWVRDVERSEELLELARSAAVMVGAR